MLADHSSALTCTTPVGARSVTARPSSPMTSPGPESGGWVRSFIAFDEFVRCICIGGRHVAVIRYDPRERRYHDDEEFLAPDLRREIVRHARRLCRALGYGMNSLEFAIKDGVPYAIDFMNPAPDMDINSITPHYFDWAVKTMADLAIEMAHNPKPQRAEQRWARYLEQPA